ncbi:hypothetical protein EVC45_37200 [Paraburkholderia sp. UYCP14C]|uniref:glycosyltransferase n=1 Tax=Paraburkholderia sp. UYCP14C TaxID=2511130 RepID=UPI00102048F9|nr:glycosyltransferase [Paraburkholderia sp. UYCP14C]RZF24723.1 hypothetical protein EVC45_37200 [Paraburkholderia sp. UYCP14C]
MTLDFNERPEVSERDPSGIRHVLLCPFSNSTNRYIEIQKDLYRSAGYEVLPLSIKGLLRGGFIKLFGPKNLLVFHWLEYRPFNRKEGSARLSLVGSLLFAFYCSLILIARAKTIYFVHDHAVHDTSGFSRRLSKRLIAFIRRIADYRVVHAPDFRAQYNAHYLPHPLYWDWPSQAPTTPRPYRPTPLFSMLGVIRPYKKIDAVLSVWPRTCSLIIAGKGTPAYLATLEEIIRKRSLQGVVQLDARFLSDGEFAQKIVDSDVLILPHESDTMLVSGAFFEAIGLVPLLIARSTPFMVWASGKFENVIIFNDVEDLPDILLSVTESWPAVAESKSRRTAENEFGWIACSRLYREFFTTVERRASAAKKPVVQ